VTDRIPVTSDTVRQRERTVDNVKRLYAFFLSLSFGNVVRELVERYDQPLKPYADTILQHPMAGAAATRQTLPFRAFSALRKTSHSDAYQLALWAVLLSQSVVHL
jgi:hypothetical protein